jgi:hypothetical protein
MAGRGPAPRAERSRETDTKRRQSELKRLAPDDQVRGRDLPEHDWHPRTERWWRTWRESAQAQTFTETDWDFLEDTAFLHDQMCKGDSGLAAELRIRVAKFGATPEDRMRLKIAVDRDVPAAPVVAKVDPDRKSRLMAVVND